jgi:hypothetical protein
MGDSLHWNRRKRAHWWVAFLLPGFLLRALIPVGFMPMVGPDHGIRLVVCESYAPVPWTTSSMSMDMPMDMPMDMTRHAATEAPGHPHTDHAARPDGHSPAHQGQGTCPYGSGPALGALPTLAVLPEAIQRSPDTALASSQIRYFEVSPRAQSPRGPPA